MARRLSTFEGSDVIFVLENGKVVEKINHKELIALSKNILFCISILVQDNIFLNIINKIIKYLNKNNH